MSQTAYKFQIVSEGVYEEAVNLYLKDGADINLHKLKGFFDDPNKKNVSFEIFFQNKEFKSFIGFVIEPLERSQQYINLQKLVRAITNDMKMSDAAEHVTDTFKTKVDLMSPDFKEVGFDVFWGSRGHVIVQDDKQTIPYEELLKDYPQFDGQYDDRPIMMEYAWSKNESEGVIYRYWTAHQLSAHNGLIDRDIYRKLI